MSLYGISKIKWDASHNYVEEALLHRVTRERDGQIGIDTGEVKFHYEVASLIHVGEDVYTLMPDGPGCYKSVDKVRVKAGQQEYLESENEVGQPTSTLYELVAW